MEDQLEFKITMRKTITDPAERAIRIKRLYEIFERGRVKDGKPVKVDLSILTDEDREILEKVKKALEGTN